MIITARLKDVNERGFDRLVYDENGSIVMLKNATICFDEKGKYMKPIEYNADDEDDDINQPCFLFWLCCITY